MKIKQDISILNNIQENMFKFDGYKIKISVWYTIDLFEFEFES